ncbi:dienelactone hydrolase family protein [soil metagenome]
MNVDLNPGRRPDDDPHAVHEPLRHGPAAKDAPVGMVLLHGRGDTARGILSLAEQLEARDAPGVATIAPQAAGNVWYPHPFLVATTRNEPWLTSALGAISRSVDELRAAGLPSERIVIAGFSQGACLASEWVARAGGSWGAMIALSGGLIGDDVDPARYPERLTRTTAFFGCSDVDAHIPEARVHSSARQFEAQGADVETRIYPGMAHTVNGDEFAWIVERLRALAGQA